MLSDRPKANVTLNQRSMNFQYIGQKEAKRLDFVHFIQHSRETSVDLAHCNVEMAWDDRIMQVRNVHQRTRIRRLKLYFSTPFCEGIER